jgi:sugar/nucleoside kinase (ribokinase family)
MTEAKAWPVLVGTVALDVLHRGLFGEGLPPAQLRWGGVVSNMACAMGVLGAHPRFLSVDYDGELSAAVAGHLRQNNVRWLRVPVRTPLPLFHAKVCEGGVEQEHFIGDPALEELTPAILQTQSSTFQRASVIVGCTDLPVDSLAWLGETASKCRIPFWVLSSDATQAPKLHDLEPRPSCVALNVGELVAWSGTPLTCVSEAVDILRSLLPSMGRALLTLGASGALLVSEEALGADYQAAPPLSSDTAAVGAGDVMFGCLLAARLGGFQWTSALTDATARTVGYLRGPSEATRPYLTLLSPMKTPHVQRWPDDARDLRLPTATSLYRDIDQPMGSEPRRTV